MANGWMFLNFENETDEQIEALLTLLQKEYPTIDEPSTIYRKSVMLTVPPHQIDSVRRFVQSIFPTCDVAWV